MSRRTTGLPPNCLLDDNFRLAIALIPGWRAWEARRARARWVTSPGRARFWPPGMLRRAIDRNRAGGMRRVLLPVDWTLEELHGVIQAAMGWEGLHLYEFRIRSARYV